MPSAKMRNILMYLTTPIKVLALPVQWLGIIIQAGLKV
jgi:hypothetical protein